MRLYVTSTISYDLTLYSSRLKELFEFDPDLKIYSPRTERPAYLVKRRRYGRHAAPVLRGASCGCQVCVEGRIREMEGWEWI